MAVKRFDVDLSGIAPPGIVKITDAELPKCVVCAEKYGESTTAKYLAHIGVKVGSKEWYEWNLVCPKHRHKYLAYKLVKDGPYVNKRKS